MAAFLSRLNEFSLAAKSLSNVVLVSPENVGYQPYSLSDDESEPRNFIFHVERENKLSRRANVTDHYTEDNTDLQDHIALSPTIVRVSGIVSEVNTLPPEGLADLREARDRLSAISSYAPNLSRSYAKIYQTIETFNRDANQIRNNIVSSYTGIPQITKQQEAYNFFNHYMSEKRLFRIQTPWTTINNMAIIDIEFNQGDNTRQQTSITIELKRINSSIESLIEDPPKAGRALPQSDPFKSAGNPRLGTDLGTDGVTNLLGAFA